MKRVHLQFKMLVYEDPLEARNKLEKGKWQARYLESIHGHYCDVQINDCLLNITSYGPIHQIPLYRVTDFLFALFAKSLLYIILI